jgi:hypothetical protein
MKDCGQAYDGAASMSGVYKGCQKLIKDKYPAALFVHCSAHLVAEKVAVEAPEYAKLFPQRNLLGKSMLGQACLKIFAKQRMKF